MRPGAIIAGVILLGLGTAMLLDNTGMLRVQASRLVAPLILIAIGSGIVLVRGRFRAERATPDREGEPRRRCRRRGGSTGGLWLIGVGIWMLISQTHMFGLDFHSSWPLLVIFAGFIIVLRGMR